MALWGQGDPRWIVEERPDSKNVNNWHWTERDATNWSKQILEKLFLEVKEESEEGRNCINLSSWNVNEVKSIAGEATINNRKGKLIYFYEWDIQLNYKGKLPGSDLDHCGSIHIPNLSDENDAADVDVIISAEGDSKNAEKLRQLVRKNCIKLCQSKCQQYVNDMKTEYSTGMVLPMKDNVPNGVITNKQNTTVSKGMSDLKVKDPTPDKKTSCHVSLSLTEEFKTRADELYATLTMADRLSAFTRAQCTSNPTAGGEFSILGDNIYGTYIELIPNKKMVQKWRFKEWPKDLYSIVTVTLEEKSDCTVLKLNQTGVPDYDTVRTADGWKQHFWGPIKQVFGYGAQLF